MLSRYLGVRPRLSTGDIVLFSGRGVISSGIKLASGSMWSHVGIVLRIPEYDFVCVWESTTLSGLFDLCSGSIRSGVQLVPFSDRVSSYRGRIAVRHLVIDGGLGSGSLCSLMELRNELRGCSYERSRLELFRSAFGGIFRSGSEDLSSIFCSELVAEAYQRLGLLCSGIPSNSYIPADFSSGRDLSLLGGASLSEEHFLC